MPKLTFEYLARCDRRLAALERLVTIAGESLRPDDRDWCPNVFWGRYIKPLMLPLVGFHRGRALDNAHDPDVPTQPRSWASVTAESVLDLGRYTRPAETKTEEMLRSTQAYEVAEQYLNSLLPPCRDCGCIRVGTAA